MAIGNLEIGNGVLPVYCFYYIDLLFTSFSQTNNSMSTTESNTTSTNTTTNQTPEMLNRELKECNHFCYPSTLLKCCSCEDLRPLLAVDGYKAYIDGTGWTTTAARDDGYCPVCNTKNYDKWMTRVQAQTKRKQKENEERQEKERVRMSQAEQDRVAHAHIPHGESGRVEYSSNGNVYVGHLLNGEPHGQGRMDFGENDDDILYYLGEWVHGKHQGQGKKVWMDDLWYEGEWYNGMMHGQGTCHMNNQVDSLQGRFEEDVFQD
jgi:hypothetical protein